jgi:hypothetical protein
MARSTLKRTGLGTITVPGRIVANEDGTLPPESVNNLNRTLDTIIHKLNIDGISLGDDVRHSKAGNLNAERIEVKFTAANQEREIPHSLGRVPTGVIIVMQDSNGTLKASNSWGPDKLYLTTSTEVGAVDSVWSIIVF